MPNGEPESDVGRDVLLQLRRVRLRRNAYLAARALLLFGALGAGTTALLLPTALRSDPSALAAVAASLAVTVIVILAVVARDLHRDWLTMSGAAHFADDGAALDGRLTTLHAVIATPAASSPLFPVLVEQVHARADDWTPARLVPNPVPPGPLATLLGAAGGLVVAILLMPDLLPDATRIADAPPTPPERVAAETRPRPVAPSKRESEPASDGVMPWISSMQERLREGAWGDDWGRVREALARAEATRREKDAGDGTSVLPFARTAAADRKGPTPDGPAGASARGDGQKTAPEPSPSIEPGSNGEPSSQAQAGSHGGGSGAGTASDEQLFTETPAPTARQSDAFTLAIAARVRARNGPPRPPTGDAPPLEPDARPALARQQRPATPFHRMTIPPEYATLVRRLFVHDTPPPSEVR